MVCPRGRMGGARAAARARRELPRVRARALSLSANISHDNQHASL